MAFARKVIPKAEETPVKSYPAMDFARRLHSALGGHPDAPPGHGRQKWLRDLIREQVGIDVSPEAVRKWFAGEARPRPAVMKKIAQAMEVDEAWLSLGITPTETPTEAKRRNAVADGAINLVAGLIQMQGGHIAFADEDEEAIDIHAIIGGKRVPVEVVLARQSGDSITFKVRRGSSKRAIIGVLAADSLRDMLFVRIPHRVIDDHAQWKGGYFEVDAAYKGSTFRVGDAVLPQLSSFGNL